MTAIGSTSTAGSSTSSTSYTRVGSGGSAPSSDGGGQTRRQQQPNGASSYDGPVQRQPFQVASNQPGVTDGGLQRPGALSGVRGGGQGPQSSNFTDKQEVDQAWWANEAR